MYGAELVVLQNHDTLFASSSKLNWVSNDFMHRAFLAHPPNWSALTTHDSVRQE